MSYRIFKRRPYTKTAYGFVFNSRARCTTIRRGVPTAQEARDICAQGPANIAIDQGKEYRHLMFYEFEKE